MKALTGWLSLWTLTWAGHLADRAEHHIHQKQRQQYRSAQLQGNHEHLSADLREPVRHEPWAASAGNPNSGIRLKLSASARM